MAGRGRGKRAAPEEGFPVVLLLPYLVAFVGTFVALWTAPGLASAVTAAVVLAAATVGAAMVGARAHQGGSLLFTVFVPAVMLAFLLIPLQSWLTGWLAGLACDDAHPVLAALLERVSRDPTSHAKQTTTIFSACFTEAGDDPQITLLPGIIWAVILLVWFFLAFFVGIFVHAWRTVDAAPVQGAGGPAPSPKE